jgi:hypothetical protein
MNLMTAEHRNQIFIAYYPTNPVVAEPKASTQVIPMFAIGDEPELLPAISILIAYFTHHNATLPPPPCSSKRIFPKKCSTKIMYAFVVSLILATHKFS